MTPEELLGPTVTRSGHFLLESGHHSDLWLELELLCRHPRRIEGAVTALADELRGLAVEVLCGPLNEGAFVALMAAAHLDLEFVYAERFEGEGSGLFPVSYRLPRVLRPVVAGRRVAIVNDVISAGSAVRGAHADLVACGATPVALAALLVLGEAAVQFATAHGMQCISLARRPFPLWTPAECPLCAAGVPLDPI